MLRKYVIPFVSMEFPLVSISEVVLSTNMLACCNPGCDSALLPISLLLVLQQQVGHAVHAVPFRVARYACHALQGGTLRMLCLVDCDAMLSLMSQICHDPPHVQVVVMLGAYNPAKQSDYNQHMHKMK